MKQLVTSKEFGLSVCSVLGIDVGAVPVKSVELFAEGGGGITELTVRFHIPYGFLAMVDAEMERFSAEVGAGWTAKGDSDE